MIGHIKPKVCKLPSQAKDSYMKLYCSICHSLRHQFGILSTLFVNSELAIVLLALRDYFVPKESWYRCPAKLHSTRKPVLIHEAVNHAAGLSLLLGWLKLLDWETDGPALHKKVIRKSLDKKAYRILASLRKESRSLIQQYRDLVAGNSKDFLYVRRMSHLLSEIICIELGERTMISSDSLAPLSEFFGLIGELVSIADPLIDLHRDVQRGEYKPIWEAAAGNSLDVSHEYERFRSEYHLAKNRTIREMDSPELRDILNTDFRTALKLGLDNLSSRINTKRGSLIGSGFALHSRISSFAYSLFAASGFYIPNFSIQNMLKFSNHQYRITRNHVNLQARSRKPRKRLSCPDWCECCGDCDFCECCNCSGCCREKGHDGGSDSGGDGCDCNCDSCDCDC
jgi:hypothetical protein